MMQSNHQKTIKPVSTLAGLPPHDKEAEEAVIGSLLLDHECIFEIKQFLTSDDFFLSQTKWCYEACCEILKRGEAINQITLAHELTQSGKLTEIGGAAYLRQLVANCGSHLYIKEYGQIVKRCSIQRRVIQFGNYVQGTGYVIGDTKELLADIGKKYLDIQKLVGLPSLQTPTDIADLGVQRYADLRGGKGLSAMTGFRQLDYEIGGAFPGEYWILGARPGVGKTTTLLSIAEHVAKKDKDNVLFCSLEMDSSSILDRRISSRVEKHPKEIRGGFYNDDTYDNIVFKLASIAESNLYFYGVGETESGITTDSLYSVARYMQMSYGLKLIIVDYLGLFEDRYGKSSYDQVSYISKRIKNMARNLNVPIICASQLSRALEQHTDKKPQLADLRESGRLEEDADVVLFLYRDDYYDRETENKGNAEILIAKQRQGDANKSIPLEWDPVHRCYVDRH